MSKTYIVQHPLLRNGVHLEAGSGVTFDEDEAEHLGFLLERGVVMDPHKDLVVAAETEDREEESPRPKPRRVRPSAE